MTSYGYDLLNNLTSVTQLTQSRSFSYSTLSRLFSATNPESGTASYRYDNNGNTLAATDARNTTATMTYDGLNRMKSKSYSGGSATATGPVNYTYDQGGIKGALSMVNSGNNSTSYTYDPLGRMITSTQTVAAQSYAPFSYTYSLTDQLTGITYPSGRSIAYSLDSAGRVTGATGNLQGNPTPYTSGMSYTAAGLQSAVTLGNGVPQMYSWNDRLQPTGVSIGSSGSLLGLNFYPCPGGATQCATPASGSGGNNGNILRQDISIGGSLMASQSYAYDSLNRLTTAEEKTTAGSSPTCPDATSVWCEQYNYDAVGNRTVANQSNTPPATGEVTSISPATNQIQDTGWHYDAAGNITATPLAAYINYDAEGRQAAFCSGALNTQGQCTALTQYVYDGIGQRVQTVEASGNTVTYLYDAFGNLAAEYGATGVATGTQYLATDHLGSTRLVMGTATERHDYLPFGNDLGATAGTWRAGTGLGYGPQSVRQRFTGSEHDVESGLEFMQARYYHGPQGRFFSPDPGNAGASLGDPQSWNGYSYVSNNPMNAADPSGLGIFGDIGSIIGSIFPGVGTLLGWGIGSIADLATGQSISPPGFDFGGAIVGSIAGSVNNGQPWNEQLPSGVDSIGVLNTGTVFGSGKVGGMIFSFTDAACNAAYAVDFVKLNLDAAAEVAARLRVPTQNVLGLSAAESRYGLDWNATKVADNGHPTMNFFSLQGNAKSPFANGSVLSGKGTRLSAFPSYKAAAQSFEAQFGGLVTGKVDPIDFARALVPRFNSGKAPLGNPRFVPDLVNTIGMTQRRMACQ